MATISQSVTPAFANIHLPTQIIKSCQEQRISFDRKTEVAITDEIIKLISKQILFKEGYTSFLTFQKKRVYPDELGHTGIEIKIDICDETKTPLRTITQLFYQKRSCFRLRFSEPISPRVDFPEPKDEFLDSYFRRTPVDRDFAQYHLPRPLFNFCIENGIEFHQPNQNRIDLPVSNRRHPLPAEKSLLVFNRVAKDQEEEDLIEFDLKLINRNGEVIEKTTEAFLRGVWEGNFGIREATHSFLDKFYPDASRDERDAIIDAINEQPENQHYFFRHIRHFLRDQAQFAKWSIEKRYLGQKPSRLELAYNALFRKLPRRVQEALHYGQHRIEDIGNDYPKITALFSTQV